MRTKNIKWIFLLFLGLPFKILGQVNLQTGAAQINIPLFSYSDNYGLNCGATLNYINGNGLKVNESASNVGTGWTLVCGGSIERVQNGEPDDQQRPADMIWTHENSFTNFANTYYPNGFLYSSYPTSDIIDRNAAFFPLLPSPVLHYLPNPKYTEDREQDYFNFSFNGRSGTFVIGRNGNIKILGDSRLIITKEVLDMHSSNIRTTINSFLITDENGIQYLFKEKILSEVCNYENTSYPDQNGLVIQDDGSTVQMARLHCGYISCNNSASYDYKIFQARRLHQFTVNSWYLSEIINPRTIKKIIFNYEDYNIDFRGESILQSGTAAGRNSITLTIKRYLFTAKRLVNVITPNQISVHFTYSSDSRKDFLNDKALVNIDYRINGSSKYSYDFNYGYFFKDEIKDYNYQFSSNDLIWTRLCLKTIQKKGSNGTTEPPYKFNYNIEGGVPARNTLWQDKWGFHKDRPFFMPDFVFDPNLSTFQTPSDYSLNDLSRYPDTYRQVTQDKAKYGIIKSIQYPQGGSLSFEYEQRDALFNNQNTYIGGVRVNKTILFDGSDHAKDIIQQYNYHDALNNSTGWGYEEPIFSRTQNVIMVKPDNNNMYPGLISRGISLAVSYNNLQMASVGSVGRIANHLKAQANFQASVENFIVVVIMALIDYFSSNEVDYSCVQYAHTPYNINSLSVQYSGVEVSQNLLNSVTGKTVYQFMSSTDLPLSVPVLGAPFANKQRQAYWVYGLPKKISVIEYRNNIFHTVKETEYAYNPTYFASYINDPNYLSKKWEPIVSRYVPRDAYDNFHYWEPSSTTDNILSDSYYPLTGRAELTSVIEKLYNIQGDYIVMGTNFTYNQNNQVNFKRTIDSKGQYIDNKIFYPIDYSNIGIFADIISNNQVNTPISSETWIENTSGVSRLVSASATEFGHIGNNDIKPIKSYKLESPAPLLPSNIQPFNPNSVVRDANYIKEQEQYVYDNAGNLVETISKGRMSSIFYDYNESLITATITNSHIQTSLPYSHPGWFAYTSFEAQKSGGWNYNPDGIRQQFAPTGKFCYQLSSNNSLSVLMGITKTYLLSFWASNSNVQVNGNFNPTKTVNTIPGWTYYEFEIAAGTPPPYISGSALIDEVRLYAKDARMTTFTYDGLHNKISECDVNNHITYYEYDGLSRVKVVKDEKGNVIKAYEYNYKQ